MGLFLFESLSSHVPEFRFVIIVQYCDVKIEPFKLISNAFELCCKRDVGVDLYHKFDCNHVSHVITKHDFFVFGLLKRGIQLDKTISMFAEFINWNKSSWF